MTVGCDFDPADFSPLDFAVCVTTPTDTTAAPRTRHPVQISIATGKPIDLLTLTDEQLVDIQIQLAGGTAATAITHPALAFVEHTSGGVVRAECGTEAAAVLVDRVCAGHAEAAFRASGAAGIINDDLEILYLAGVL